MSLTRDDSDEYPGQLLHQAALWDNADFLEDLLNGDQIEHLNAQDAWGRTALYTAVTTEDSRCLRSLLQAGADPNIAAGPREEGKTCLHQAAQHGAVQNIRLLLSHGADLLAKDAKGMTALDLAEQGGHDQCMATLKEAADSRELARQELHTSLRSACSAGDVGRARAILRDLGTEAEAIINSMPNAANTLLFKACEEGQRDLVKLLLEYGADGRVHPVTKYSPLYISCHYGRKELVEILLKRFPHLVGVATIERWLPFHACIINGHTAIMDLLLKYPYPGDVLHKFRYKLDQWEYLMPFDINLKDVTGQSALYLACYVGNVKQVDLLLKFQVAATKTKKDLASDATASTLSPLEVPSKDPPHSPTKLRISGSIQALMSKLNLARGTVEPVAGLPAVVAGDTICPVYVDLYCNSDSETALHVAVKNKHYNIVSLLLAAGADPNLRIYLPDDEMTRLADEDYVFTGSTALVEACRNRDLGMLDLLLKKRARDDECKALYVASQSKDEIIVSKLLALKAHPDPEYKVNKRSLELPPNQQFSSTLAVGCTSIYTSLHPTSPVMINWHAQGCLTYIKEQWLLEAAVSVNPKLKLSPKNQIVSLYAITRLDVSHNALAELPDVVFQLPSLKILNAAQNKIDKLPVYINEFGDGNATLPRKSLRRVVSAPLSVLEEIHLQDNRLDHLPDFLFQLPALQLLDVSNNKLPSLPYRIWSSPKLRELNVAFNLLRELPTRPDVGIAGDLAGMMSDGGSEPSDEESVASSTEQSIGVGEEGLSGEEPGRKRNLDARSVLSLGKHGNVITCRRQRELRHHTLWSAAVEIRESFLPPRIGVQESGLTEEPPPGVAVATSCLRSLNLAHNDFSSVPAGLACLALSLNRLNLSYNRLSEMGPLCEYPLALKQLDISHNNIRSWPTMVNRSESSDSLDAGLGSVCYSLEEAVSRVSRSTKCHGKSPRSRSSARPRSSSVAPAGGGVTLSLPGPVTTTCCVHRRHIRLEALRTLVLSDNLLSRLCLYVDDNDFSVVNNVDDFESNQLRTVIHTKGKLLFPNLSMLDVSNNSLRELPSNLHELTNLSVLNISGNIDITELPPEMGLLSRLWNLSTRGCSLQEPLKGMIESKKYKTMDVIGFLKSILEDARPYARMKLMIVGVQGIGKTSLLEQLRQEGTGTYKRKPVEHWAKRMGNKNINTHTARGTTLSTVGVDIGEWAYERKVRGHSSYGPVVFRTWDFGGQREYYATHQYFLSKRSLYLVVWKISDGERGVEEILQWLVNIQARAPNSPVLIVGTHYDLVREKFPSSWSEDLQQMIRDRFINVIDADKLGLPRVLDTIEVSCKTRHNVKLLCNLIYDTVFGLKISGSKERMLEQRIPSLYLALEEVVANVAVERRHHNLDPVLTSDKYRALVEREMISRGHRPFRDLAELNQATAFLHENGVLLHYEDATLRDLYFLDPQWLCDMLAHVVTIREINPFARNGLMKLDDLKHVFKSSTCAPVDAKSYIVNLLNKFEVALTWDSRTLLVPSLLPTEAQLCSGLPGSDVRIPIRSRVWASRSKRYSGTSSPVIVGNSTFFIEERKDVRLSLTQQGPSAADLIGSPQSESPFDNLPGPKHPLFLNLSHRSSPTAAIRRLLIMSYFPAGFWPRLLTRVLADETAVNVVKNYFVVPDEFLKDMDTSAILGGPAEWVCWQTGMELRYAHMTLFRIRELLPLSAASSSVKKSSSNISVLDYKSLRFLVKQEGTWCDMEMSHSSVLEILLPNEAVVIKRPMVDGFASPDGGLATGVQSLVLDPSPECLAKLLSLAVDHMDTLLEDWYPTLGTRFVHTSEGKFLVTRLIPCPVCLQNHGPCETPPPQPPTGKGLPENWGSFVDVNPLYSSMTSSQISQELAKSQIGSLERSILTSNLMSSLASAVQVQTNESPTTHQPPDCAEIGAVGGNVSPTLRGRHSYGSQGSDGDSGVGAESASSSRKPSEEGHPALFSSDPVMPDHSELTPVVYSFMVEECILAAYSSRFVTCPLHGDLLLAQLAPDTVFLDLGDQYLLPPEGIKQGRMLGRGGFGFVFQGTCRRRPSEGFVDVALKMLQPIDPGSNARASAAAAFKAAENKWERDPLQYACKAYCSARQEVNILLALRHAHIVPLVGVCPRPLALVLELAPQGALDQCLRHYQRSGARLTLAVLQTVVLQVAKALEYLHDQRIIYRDLKSENVLVWKLPPPFEESLNPVVDVRLADYGISRSALPSGAKGFGGTEGFMAPEMMRYNGEEEYTEKVDCFSFGMFVYELVTTHQPYEQCDNVKEMVLEGGRPTLALRDTEYPVYLLDLMVICWHPQPQHRPSMSQVVSIATAPEFTHLVDVVGLDHSLNIMDAVPVPLPMAWNDDREMDDDLGCIWVSRSSPQLDMVGLTGWGFTDCTTVEGLPETVTAMCCVGDTVWLGDNAGKVHGYCSTTYSRLFTYCLEPDAPQLSPVRAMNHLEKLQRVAVALCNGRLFLCHAAGATVAEGGNGDGTFVLAELAGATEELHCLAGVLAGDAWSLWCGGSQGLISIFTLRQNGHVGNQEVISHCTVPPDNPKGGKEFQDVLILRSGNDNPGVTDGLGGSMWSYVYPGCVVYHWDCFKREIINRLDCSKLAPCSESLQSISIEEHLSPSHCQVSAMAVCGKELYVGTAWGCIVVAEAVTLRPITVFRPYQDEVRAIVPLAQHGGHDPLTSRARGGSSNSCPSSPVVLSPPPFETPEPAPLNKPCSLPVVMTVGRGYRSLLSRYAPKQQIDATCQRTMYSMLWRTHEWFHT